MNSRERVLRSIEFRKPDRTPILNPLPPLSDFFFIFAYPQSDWQPAEGNAPYIHDLLYLIGNWRWSKWTPLNWPGGNRMREDEFGCVREALTADTVGEVTVHPLADIEDSASLVFPDPCRPERFETFERLAATLGRGKFIIGDLGVGLWERVHFLRGFPEVMEDLALNPDAVARLLDRLIDEWFDGLCRELAARGCDAVMMTDDWGMQDRLMVSPAMWRKIFKPRYQRLFAVAHDLGMKFIMHSCGQIVDILDDLIEVGLDVLQKDDIEVFGTELLQEKYAGRICFLTSLDVQRTLPKASDADIRREIRTLIGRLGSKGGGLMSHFYTQPSAIGLTYRHFFLQQMWFMLYGWTGSRALR